MELDELFEFIDLEDKRLLERFKDNFATDKEIVLARSVKLSEEVGELSSEVLSFNGDQRKEKLDNHDKESLSLEFADVIITSLLLAKSMNVDVREALIKKVEKINKRYE